MASGGTPSTPSSSRVIALHDVGSALLQPGRALAQLGEAQGAGHVVEPVVDTELVDLLVPGTPIRGPEPGLVTDETDEVELVRALGEVGGSLKTAAPPSPVVMFLVGKKEKVVM